MKRLAAIFSASLIAVSSWGQTAADVIFPTIPELEHPYGVEVLFSPEHDIQGRILDAINNAKFEVLVNHYLITNPRIKQALIKKFREKKSVVVILDAKPAVRDYRGITDLDNAGLPVIPLQSANGSWNNTKYIIIDREIVLIGTGDLTNAARNNRESLIVMMEPSIVISFYNHFVKTAKSDP